MMVVAGAGTGKTYSIVQRILAFVQLHNIRADQILVLTFTVKAAKELSERVSEAFASAGLASAGAPTIKTFHSLAYLFIASSWRECGFSCRPTPLTTDSAKLGLLKRVMMQHVRGKRLGRCRTWLQQKQKHSAAATQAKTGTRAGAGAVRSIRTWAQVCV